MGGGEGGQEGGVMGRGGWQRGGWRQGGGIWKGAMGREMGRGAIGMGRGWQCGGVMGRGGWQRGGGGDREGESGRGQ